MTQDVVVVGLIVVWVAVIINFIITLALVRRLTELLDLARSNARPEMIKIGEIAPDMKLLDLDGHLVTKANYLGSDVAIVFLAPNCQPCLDAVPSLQAIYPIAHANEIQMLIVSMTNIEQARKFAEDAGLDTPIYALPPDSSLRNDYRIFATPSYYLLDRNWHVTSAGSLDSEWRNIVEKWKARANHVPV